MNTQTTMMDLLFNLILGFVCLLLLAFIQINKKPIDASVPNRALYIIELTWDGESDTDIDSLLEMPGGVIYYQNRELGSVFLDKDDLGRVNDSFRRRDGSIQYVSINQEIITIRGIEPGEYIFNAYMYRLGRQMDGNEEPVPISVRAVLRRCRDGAILAENQIELNFVRDEGTFFRFTLTDIGEVVDIDLNLPKQILRPMSGSQGNHE